MVASYYTEKHKKMTDVKKNDGLIIDKINRM
jgi:hypothetical protein